MSPSKSLDLVILGALGLLFASGARYGIAADGGPGPGAAPALFGGAMLLFVAIEFVTRAVRLSAPAPETDDATLGTLGAWAACLGTLAALALFGGVAGTFVSLAAVAALAIGEYGFRAWRDTLVFAAIAAGAIHLVFNVVFQLTLMPALITDF